MIIAGQFLPYLPASMRRRLVLSQEMGKEASEVLRKLGTDVGEVFKVVVQWYRFQLFRGLRSGVHLVVHVELIQVYVIDHFLLHGC